jgi:hypothetical protein
VDNQNKTYIQNFNDAMPSKSSIYDHPQIFRINGLVLHKIKDIQNFNTPYTSNCPLLIIHFMTNETYQNCTKLHKLMKIYKHTNILKVISLNYNHYNSCNHFSKSWECRILCMYTQSLAPFTTNTPRLMFAQRCFQVKHHICCHVIELKTNFPIGVCIHLQMYYNITQEQLQQLHTLTRLGL